MVKTRQWLLAKKPTDLPELDGPDATFKLAETDLPEPKDDEVLVKLVYLSNVSRLDSQFEYLIETYH
jgi:hypothetical protein